MRQVRGEIPASCLSFIPMYSWIFCPVTVRVADIPGVNSEKQEEINGTAEYNRCQGHR